MLVVGEKITLELPLTATLEDVRAKLRDHYEDSIPASEFELFHGEQEAILNDLSIEKIRDVYELETRRVRLLLEVVTSDGFANTGVIHIIADVKIRKLEVLHVDQASVFTIENVRGTDIIESVQEKIRERPEYSAVPTSAIQLYLGGSYADVVSLIRRDDTGDTLWARNEFLCKEVRLHPDTQVIMGYDRQANIHLLMEIGEAP